MRVFVELLLTANIRDNDFMGITVHRGELATSLRSLANNLNLTIQSIRTALDHLKSTGEITSRRHSKFQVISIVNYERYQQASTNSPTFNQQSINNQSTFNQQQLKNNKNIRNKEIKNKGGEAAGFSGFTMEGFADFLNGKDDDE